MCETSSFIFNRMLALLRSVHASKKNLRWFGKFLSLYNDISLYDHRPTDFTLELDACLTGLGERWGNFVYYLPISCDFMNWSIVHLEMVNILLAVRLFQNQWSGCRVLTRCDNEAVVTVLRSGRTRILILVHVPGISGMCRSWLTSTFIMPLLEGWTGSPQDVGKLLSQAQNPVWVPVDI